MTSNTGDFGQENPSKSQIHPQLHPHPHRPFSPGAAGAPPSGKSPLKKTQKKTKPEEKNGGEKRKRRKLRLPLGGSGGCEDATGERKRLRGVPPVPPPPVTAGSRGHLRGRGSSSPPGLRALRGSGAARSPPGASGSRRLRMSLTEKGVGSIFQVREERGYRRTGGTPIPALTLPSLPGPRGGGVPGFVGSRRRRRRRDSPGRALPAARDAPAPHALPPERRGRSSPFPARFQNKASGKEPREGGRGCRALG